jgi:FkbM family methyltransferase
MYSLFKKRQDAFEISLLEQHVRKNDVVLDIGANIGFYAQLLSQLVGKNGKVHCFEPDQVNFKHLLESVGNFNNIVPVNKAVGSETGTITLYTSKSLNVDHRTYQPEDFENKIEIGSVSIDDYLGSDKKADFIKIDIQGFEMQAIKGMEKILNTNANIKIVSEFWPYGLKTAGSSVTEYFGFLKNKGFEVFLLKNNRLQKLTLTAVQEMEGLPAETYFNIFASRSDV